MALKGQCHEIFLTTAKKPYILDLHFSHELQSPKFVLEPSAFFFSGRGWGGRLYICTMYMIHNGRFRYGCSFPQPQSIPLRPFRIFSKIRGDIRSSRFATDVNDTGGKWKKSSIRKMLIILFSHLWVVEETYL
jgi:hypothetical protein